MIVINNSITQKPNILVITHPFDTVSGQATLSGLINAILPSSNFIVAITGKFKFKSDNIKIIDLSKYGKRNSMVYYIILQIYIQVLIAFYIIKYILQIDIVILSIGARAYLLPLLILKIFRIRILTLAAGSSRRVTEKANAKMGCGSFGRLISNMAEMLEQFTYLLSDRIGVIIQSENIIKEFRLEKHRKKIIPFGSLYLGDNFTIFRALKDRENIVGYVGYLGDIKGVLELIKAVPIVLEKNKNIRFIIIGDGPLRKDIERELVASGCYGKVSLLGWIQPDDIHKYYNSMKLHILPSHSEGFAKAAIEAMACGAISIATPVGVLPDIIIEGKTGFILEDNCPTTIANKIIEVFSYTDEKLYGIQTESMRLVDKNFRNYMAINICKVAIDSLSR